MLAHIRPEISEQRASPPAPAWHQMPVAEVAARLDSDARQGLAAPEVGRRLAQVGPNELPQVAGRSRWRILLQQLTSTLILVLLVAAGISAVLGDLADALAIVAIVALNAVLGTVQESRAEQAIAALRRLAVPVVRVRRGGRVEEHSARDLVPGDLVLLEAGTRVPADGRLVESAALRLAEAALTGESQPVDKVAAGVLAAGVPLAERRNMVYMGTEVGSGRGLALVTATGMATELGHIAGLIRTSRREPTPLERQLRSLGRRLALVALVLVTVVFVAGLVRGGELRLTFFTAVSLAVAAVPEGLPAVVTIALALGAQRMLRRQALIRRLPAVETLGAVTVICTDKTGTLTRNEMAVTAVELTGGGSWSPPAGGPGAAEPELLALLAAAALCNDALADGAGGAVLGDPTEAALVRAAAKAGLVKGELEACWPRLAELPFDADRKRMTTVHRCSCGPPPAWAPLAQACAVGPEPCMVLAKGAFEGLLACADRLYRPGGPQPLDAAARERLHQLHDHLASRGMRVLAVACRPLPAPPPDLADVECGLVLLGLLGLSDPPRPEAAAAVATCRAAGIRPLMITGDHPLTARAIAEQLQLDAGAGVLTGQDLERLSEAELEGEVARVSVYARVSPEHKLRLVRALQRRGEVVAMTGDGVNDAPALKQANIGVAMGRIGTDVAKEAADMVLQDDNFATIVAAVAEGRAIFDNIRKFIKYLLSANSAELWVMLLAPLAGLPLPLLPLQILWMNLITDGLPALALGLEPPEQDVMRRSPHPPRAGLLGRGLGLDVIWLGLFMGLCSLGLGLVYWRAGDPAWQTVVFTTLTLSQMFLALAVRSERHSLWRIGLGSNRALLAAVVLSGSLQLAVVYLPGVQALFHTRSLPAADLGLCLLVSTATFWALELRKAWWLRVGGASSR